MIEHRAERKAELKLRRARVVAIEEEGEAMEIAFTLDNGERVIGCFNLVGWAQAPKDERDDILRRERVAPYVY